MIDTELDALNVELTTDPKSLGLVAMNNPEAAARLNEISASSEIVSVGVINGQELQKAVVISEYVDLSVAARDGWIAIISAGDGQVDVDDQRVIDQVTAIWPGTTTLINLAALRTRPASRAEVLFGVLVSYRDVAKARLYHGE